jgi:DNA-binding CsgD family transcriptional regulator
MSDELKKLVIVHRRIVEMSNLYHRDKPVLERERMDTIKEILMVAEKLFPNLIVLIYGPTSERLYFSDRVKSVMGYSVEGLVNMSDDEFLAGIHPDDVEPVRLCMELILAMYSDPQYDHSSIRYRISLRYRRASGEYASIVYEAVTIKYKDHYADLALIGDNGLLSPDDRVELVIEKKIADKFVMIKHFIPAENVEVTDREFQIIELIRQGQSNQQIGEVLGISVSTVKNHKQNLFKKFNAKNSLHLMRLLERKMLAGTNDPSS